MREGPRVIDVVTDRAPASPAASLVVRVAPYAAPSAEPPAEASGPLTEAPAPSADASAEPPVGPEAAISVAIGDPVLAGALTDAVAAAVAAAVADSFAGARPSEIRTIAIRSRKALARVAGELAGAIAIVAVTARNARHLIALVDQLRAAGAAGIQLVWDGATPPRAEVERHVFAVLEHARATPAAPPVVLAASPPTAPPVVLAATSSASPPPAPAASPPAALLLLIAHRARSARKEDVR